MIKSMTGYGRASIKEGQTELTVEIKSFNHRYLDTFINIPKQWLFLEDHIKSVIRKMISRGKIDLSLSIQGQGLINTEVVVDYSLLNHYINEIQKISDTYGIENDVKLSHILNLSEIFQVKEFQDEKVNVERLVTSLVQTALERLIKMRSNEGNHLYQDFSTRLSLIEQYIKELKALAPVVSKSYQTRLSARIQEAIDHHLDVNDERLLSEVAIYAEKTNIDEEITRLSSHVDQFYAILKQEGSIGRKLDFLIQEMNREINTIGSKGNNIDISRIVVEVKSEIEKMREQVQNIE